jgi:hypothetical protein
MLGSPFIQGLDIVEKTKEAAWVHFNTGDSTITNGIRMTAIHFVEHPSEGISTARLHPSAPAISGETLLLHRRSQNLTGSLAPLSRKGNRAWNSSHVAASILESQVGRCPDG